MQTSGTHTFETCLGLKGTTATIYLEDVRGAIETVHNFRQTSRDLNINGKHMDLLREISRKETFNGANQCVEVSKISCATFHKLLTFEFTLIVN